jgi:ABC-type transport system involved in multi-copper enzyme maturation permease subunit
MNVVVIEETVRRHVTNAFYIAYVALAAIVSLGVSSFSRPASMWPSLISALAIVAGSGVIGPEFSSGTLQLVLVKPVNRAVYLLSRVAGVVIAVWIAAGVGALCEVLGRLIWNHATMPWPIIGGALLNAMCDAVLTIALLALLGSLTRAYFNVAIYFALMIGFSAAEFVAGMLRSSGNAIGRFLAAHLEIERALNTIGQNLFPDVTPRLDRNWLLMVLANASVALLLACFAFRRREVPYGAD